MRARIAEKVEVADRTLLVRFDLLGEEAPFVPGQYFWVTLLDAPYDDERGTRRHFTVVTSPNERNVLGFCTRLRDSAFKRSIATLAVGAEVDVEQPKGSFTLPESEGRPYVFLAGGIGITPFRSMLRFAAEEGRELPVTLVYSNRNRTSAAFLDELQELERTEPSFRLLATMTDDPGWTGETRRVDGRLLRDHLGADLAAFTYLVAGPPGMVNGVTGELTAAGVPDERVHAERFSGY